MKSVAAECALLREGAYALMKYEKQQLRAEEAINQAIVLGDYNQQLPVTEQLKLLEVKGIIDLSAPAPDFSSKYLEKGLEISSQRSLFATKQEHLYFKA